MIPATVLLLATLTPILALVMLALGFTIVRQRRQIRELACEARHDQLTGLPNRRALAAHWPTMPAGSDILLVDLVGFKGVNDSFGHIVGDALLREVAARLAAAVPPPGLIVRWGGDEFIAAVPPAAPGSSWGCSNRRWRWRSTCRQVEAPATCTSARAPASPAASRRWKPQSGRRHHA